MKKRSTGSFLGRSYKRRNTAKLMMTHSALTDLISRLNIIKTIHQIVMEPDLVARFRFTNHFDAIATLALLCSALSIDGLAQTRLVPGAGNTIHKSITPVA